MKGCILVMACLALPFFGGAQNLDERILKSINSHGPAFKDDFFKFSAGSVYPVTAAVPAVQFTLGVTQRKGKFIKDGLWTSGVFLTNLAFTQALKYVFNRQRPFETLPYIVKRTHEPNGHSMPSGHSATAFCAATWLTLQYKKWYVAVPAYLWASTVAYARMYQGVHYPSDVLAGAVVGSGIAWAGYKLQQHRYRKQVAIRDVAKRW